MANLDFTGINPADYTTTPWTGAPDGLPRIADAKGRWKFYVAPVTGSGITITNGIASTTISGTDYFWPVFETNPNA